MRGIYVNGELVRRLRTEQGLSQDDLAVRADRNARTIRNAEAGKRLDPQTVSAIAEALSLEVARLVVEAPDQDDVSRNCVEKLFQAYQARNIDQVVKSYTKDATLRYPESVPILPWSTFTGAKEIRQHARLWLQTFDQKLIEQPDSLFLVRGSQVCYRQLFLTTIPASETQLELEMYHEFQLSEDKIKRHISIFDVSVMVDVPTQAIN